MIAVVPLGVVLMTTVEEWAYPSFAKEGYSRVPTVSSGQLCLQERWREAPGSSLTHNRLPIHTPAGSTVPAWGDTSRFSSLPRKATCRIRVHSTRGRQTKPVRRYRIRWCHNQFDRLYR